MKITRVQIKNWRSIKDVDFNPEPITVLVGPNNAGKSNILGAINFVLGERWPMHANLLESDYYAGNTTQDVYIRLNLDHPRIGSVVFDTSRPKYHLHALDHDGREIIPFGAPEREAVAFAYVDAGRNYDRQFGVSRWTLFGQAVRKLHDDLKGSDQAVLDELREVLDKAHGLLKTDLYQDFERNLRDAFRHQLKTSRYEVSFEFKTIDETNLYRSLYPALIEGGRQRSPPEVGSGIRNLLVLALFQAVAKTFRGGAILGIEEPELYLHPHAQRGLMARFEALAADGNQIFMSTHSAAFVDVTHSQRIVLVERCGDEEEEVCTQTKTTGPHKLLQMRKKLHPQKADMTEEGRKAFLRNIRTPEMAEAFFARLVVVVEGPTEREALPFFLAAEGIDLDAEGVSIVSAGGKQNVDAVAQLYLAHQLPVFTIFDNDVRKGASAVQSNRTLCRLLGLPEEDMPAGRVTPTLAILHGDWEAEMLAGTDQLVPGLYQQTAAEARAALNVEPGKNKPLVGRYVAEKLSALGQVPMFVRLIAAQLRTCLTELNGGAAEQGRAPAPAKPPVDILDLLDDEIPF